jgi:XTP/dITP diphosphohydrolase
MRNAILIASFNHGKVREIQESLSSALVECRGLDTIPGVTPCVEEGETFEENACEKAVHYSRFSPWLTLADDSGLMVDALDGEPGIHSARFISDSATDNERCQEILRQMKHVPVPLRSARFVCVIALAEKGQVKALFEGRVEGRIAQEAVGENGFGYDPIFLIPETGKTLAQLNSAEKLVISHRGRALEKLKQALSTPEFPTQAVFPLPGS